MNLIGLGVLCDGRTAFINCTHQGLLTDYFALLPPDDVVIEIQKDVPADADVVKACERLKQGGYSIALDNFVTDDTREALVPYADLIKVDITKVGSIEYVALAARYTTKTRRMVAHKKWRAGNISSQREMPVSQCFKDIFSSTRRICKSGRFPPTRLRICVC